MGLLMDKGVVTPMILQALQLDLQPVLEAVLAQPLAQAHLTRIGPHSELRVGTACHFHGHRDPLPI